jgi:transposase InsO family protein
VLAPRVGVAARAVSRILRRHGAPYLRDCDPMTGEVIRSSKSTAVRYERDRPGELVHMDVTKLGRIRDGGVTPSAWPREPATAGPGPATTTPTRSSMTTPDWPTPRSSHEKGATCAAFLERAVAYCAAHGITRIERLMTDNAFAYRYTYGLQRLCAVLGIRQKFIKPHCPCQNGKVKRLNHTLASEWPTGSPSPATANANRPSHPGSSTTTLSEATAHSAPNPHQPHATNLMAGYTQRSACDAMERLRSTGEDMAWCYPRKSSIMSCTP